jgi:glycosyltransferase involved in cell wall biosynthesis
MSAGRRARRRILVVGPLPPPAHGCAVITHNLLSSQLAEEFELLHLDTADRRGIDNIGTLDAGNVWRAGAHGAQFLRMLLRERPDLLYVMPAQNTWGFLRDTLFLTPAALRGLPSILHFQSGQFDRFYDSASAPMRRLVRQLVPRAERAVVLGRALAPMLDGLVEGERIVVIPNAVPDLTGAVDRSTRRPGPVRVLYLGNLMPGKGYIELMEAARLLIHEGVDLEVTFAGNVSDERAHRAALAASADVAARLHFVGPVAGESKLRLLRDADVFAFPSHYENEGHPLVVLEAMAAGLPVVSTRYVAIPETVLDGETGLLTETGDVGALASAIRRLSVDEQLRARLGRAGRQRYLEHYTLVRWGERMGELFHDVLSATAA